MRTQWVLAVAMSFGSPACAQAQTSGVKVATDMEAPAQSADGLLTMFEGECMSAAKAMPADKYNFTPASLAIAGAKFDGVRTFADQARHLAQANYYFASVVSGIKVDANVKAIGTLEGKDEIVAALANSFAALHTANGTLTAKNAFELVDFEGTKATRMTAASFAVAHGFDHYGQMVEYLRMNGTAPPASAK